jgi:Enoyl-(Acyl carrier protein) reductase
VPGRLEGKVCVITGTVGSMGRAIALIFALEGASVGGSDVAVATAQETAQLVLVRGTQMISMQPCHLADPVDCRALVDLPVRTFRRIDVLSIWPQGPISTSSKRPKRNWPNPAGRLRGSRGSLGSVLARDIDGAVFEFVERK